VSSLDRLTDATQRAPDIVRANPPKLRPPRPHFETKFSLVRDFRVFRGPSGSVSLVWCVSRFPLSWLEVAVV